MPADLATTQFSLPVVLGEPSGNRPPPPLDSSHIGSIAAMTAGRRFPCASRTSDCSALTHHNVLICSDMSSW